MYGQDTLSDLAVALVFFLLCIFVLRFQGLNPKVSSLKTDIFNEKVKEQSFENDVSHYAS
jgi:hypothetical protein